jgi:hypothetical protein
MTGIIVALSWYKRIIALGTMDQNIGTSPNRLVLIVIYGKRNYGDHADVMLFLFLH